jgi:hypothetical protein
MSTPLANSRATKLTRWQVLGRVPVSSLLKNRVMPFADSRGSIRATFTARCGPSLTIPRKTSSHIVIILSHAKEILLLSIPNSQYRHTASVSWQTQFLGVGSPDNIGQPKHTHTHTHTHTHPTTHTHTNTHKIHSSNTCTQKTPCFEYQSHYPRCWEPWIYSIFPISTAATSQYSLSKFCVAMTL